MRPAEQLVKNLLTERFGAHIGLKYDADGYSIIRPSAQCGWEHCASVTDAAKVYNVTPRLVVDVIHNLEGRVHV